MLELEFWEDYLIEEPICKKLLTNWELIRNEILDLKNNYSNWFTNYPKFKIDDLETGKKVRMYDNNWTITALSTLTEEYSAENSRAEKTGKSTLEKLVKRYRSKLLPTLDSIINQPNKDETLTNIFVSILHPGVIIRPHQGYSKEYMRVHLGLICDPECKITVGDVTKTWEEGKLIAFKDGGPYYHSVIHNGTKDRYILSLDIKLSYLKNYIEVL
jgi:aspartyl/asparaginyl beta-hydroxylase (cupin superfamily)